LRVEAVGDASQQQEGSNQRERELAVKAVNAGGKLDRGGRDHAIECRPRMPEEVEPTRKQVAVKRIDDHHDIGPEQDRMVKTRQLHHQQEHQQADDEILCRVGTLAVDCDPIIFEQ